MFKFQYQNGKKRKRGEKIYATKQGNKGIANLGRFYGLQIGARGVKKRASFRDFRSGQKDYKLGQRDFKSGQRVQIGARGISNRGRNYKSGQGLQIGAKRFQIGAEMTNWGKRDFKSGQELQIGPRIINRDKRNFELGQGLHISAEQHSSIEVLELGVKYLQS